MFPFPSGVILFLPLRETVLALSHPPLLMESKGHFKSLTVEWLRARNCVVFLNSLFLRNCLFSKEKLKFKVMNKSHVNCIQAWQLLSSLSSDSSGLHPDLMCLWYQADSQDQLPLAPRFSLGLVSPGLCRSVGPGQNLTSGGLSVALAVLLGRV